MRGLVFRLRVLRNSLSQKFLSKSVVWRSKNDKNLSLFCAAFFSLADFLVHRSLKKRVFWVLFRVIHAFFSRT